MYNCLGTKPNSDSNHRDQKLKNKQIDKTIKSENKKKLSCLKLLLLGTGESGKSTILKQMKIIHIDGFSQSEKMEFIPIIKRNIRDGILAIVVGMKSIGIVPQSFDLHQKIQYLQTAFVDDFDYPQEFFDCVAKLWENEDVQYCWTRANEFQVIDSAQYFLDKIHQIRRPEYIPSLQDILRCRKMTNAITEINFQVKDRKKHKVDFKVLDVGGQQGERKRWIQLFGDVTAILFLADCSSFDQTLREDRLKNRLIDSLEVFNQAWINRYLQNVPILIFINKIDLLDRKIKTGHSIYNSLLLSCNPLMHVWHTGIGQQQSQSEIEQIVQHHHHHNHHHHHHHNQGRSSSVDLTTKWTTNPTCGGTNTLRRYSKDDSCQFIVEIINSFPWTQFEPTSDERKEFITSFPLDQLEFDRATQQQLNACRRKSRVASHPSIDNHQPSPSNSNSNSVTASDTGMSQHHGSASGSIKPKSKADISAAASIIHPETIRTACYIKNLFTRIIRNHPKSFESKSGRRRKHLFYYTCAVNTDNIQKVLDGCRSFLMQEHLERFGIL